MGEGRVRRAAAAAGLAALLCAVIVVASAGTASAQSVTGTQLQALAQRAVEDPRALAQLRAVREVDGRPVDVVQALSGADGPALTARLRALAAGGDPAVVAPDAARREAAEVLEGRRFRPSRVPRPLAGILTTLGRWLRPLVRPLRRIWAPVAESMGTQVALALVVFVVAGLISLRMVGRRSPRSLERSRTLGVDTEGLDPDELDRQATAAEQAGDLDHAVRLRFVAGVLRLDHAGAISYRSSMTTGQLTARLRSASFGELAAAFDEIAYGGRSAEQSDVVAARSNWPRVLAEARR